VTEFSTRTIPFPAIPQFSKLFIDYIAEAPSLKDLYSFHFSDKGYSEAVANNSYDENIRSVLVNVIREQYEKTGIAAPEDLLKDLAKEKTLTVCTGHQLCLFTGPLYFIYKIISAIRVAEEQSKKTGRKIIPVYWMASEDHDFEEISSVNLYGKTVSWKENAGGAAGRLKTDSLSSVLAEIKLLMGENEPVDNLFRLFSQAYRPGRTIAQATRELVHELFKGKILVIDPDDSRLKKFFIPVFQKDIFENAAEKYVSETATKLDTLQYSIQVNPRKINVFYLGENFRERIEEKEGKYHVLNSSLSFSKEELQKEIEAHPEKFSPNVILRPMYQQVILPNIAYVGGPGEIAYWLEYRSAFGQFKISFPVLQPRNFAIILEKHTAEKIQKLGLAVEDFFGDTEELIKNYVKKISGDSLSLEKEKEIIRKTFESIREKMLAADPTLKGAADAELQKQVNGIENMEGKLLKASKQKQETSVAQIRKLKEKILPSGILQERYENFIPFYLKYGPALMDELQAAFHAANGLVVLSEK
jgi:bacillithiol biosynthesis cysteine-adding enzyme BshC